MKFALRLYVSGHTPNSVRAIAHVRRLLDTRFAGHYTLDIVDVLKKPQLAFSDGILVAPTLLRLSPPPVKRVIGDLANPDKILTGLELPAS